MGEEEEEREAGLTVLGACVPRDLPEAQRLGPHPGPPAAPASARSIPELGQQPEQEVCLGGGRRAGGGQRPLQPGVRGRQLGPGFRAELLVVVQVARWGQDKLPFSLFVKAWRAASAT